MEIGTKNSSCVFFSEKAPSFRDSAMVSEENVSFPLGSDDAGSSQVSHHFHNAILSHKGLVCTCSFIFIVKGSSLYLH